MRGSGGIIVKEHGQVNIRIDVLFCCCFLCYILQVNQRHVETCRWAGVTGVHRYSQVSSLFLSLRVQVEVSPFSPSPPPPPPQHPHHHRCWLHGTPSTCTKFLCITPRLRQGVVLIGSDLSFLMSFISPELR